MYLILFHIFKYNASFCIWEPSNSCPTGGSPLYAICRVKKRCASSQGNSSECKNLMIGFPVVGIVGIHCGVNIMMVMLV